MKMRHSNNSPTAGSPVGKFNAVVAHAALSGFKYARISHKLGSVVLEIERRPLGSTDHVLISRSWLSKASEDEEVSVDKSTWFRFYCFKLTQDWPTKLGLIGFLIALSGFTVDAMLGLGEKRAINFHPSVQTTAVLVTVSWVAKLGGVILLFVKDLVGKK